MALPIFLIPNTFGYRFVAVTGALEFKWDFFPAIAVALIDQLTLEVHQDRQNLVHGTRKPHGNLPTCDNVKCIPGVKVTEKDGATRDRQEFQTGYEVNQAAVFPI